MDVRVRHKVTKEVQEMSEVAFGMLRHEYELFSNPKPVLVVEKSQVQEVKVSPEEYRKQLRARYEKVFGVAPHGRLKDETLLELIKEQEKGMVDTSTGE